MKSDMSFIKESFGTKATKQENNHLQLGSIIGNSALLSIVQKSSITDTEKKSEEVKMEEEDLLYNDFADFLYYEWGIENDWINNNSGLIYDTIHKYHYYFGWNFIVRHILGLVNRETVFTPGQLEGILICWERVNFEGFPAGGGNELFIVGPHVFGVETDYDTNATHITHYDGKYAKDYTKKQGKADSPYNAWLKRKQGEQKPQ